MLINENTVAEMVAQKLFIDEQWQRLIIKEYNKILKEEHSPELVLEQNRLRSEFFDAIYRNLYRTISNDTYFIGGLLYSSITPWYSNWSNLDYHSR